MRVRNVEIRVDSELTRRRSSELERNLENPVSSRLYGLREEGEDIPCPPCHYLHPHLPNRNRRTHSCDSDRVVSACNADHLPRPPVPFLWRYPHPVLIETNLIRLKRDRARSESRLRVRFHEIALVESDRQMRWVPHSLIMKVCQRKENGGRDENSSLPLCDSLNKSPGVLNSPETNC